MNDKLWKNKFVQYLFLCCIMYGIFGITSCSKESSSGLSVEEGGELRLGAAIAGVSRATDSGFEVNDTLGVYITKWKDAAMPDTLKESGNYVDNVFFRLESLNDNWLPEYSVYYPSEDNKIDLYAYYPYRPFAFVSGTSLSLTVASDQSVGNSYTRSDFMTAKRVGVSRSANKVPLVFDHRLSQMVFVLKPGAGFSVSDLLSARIRIVNAIVDGSFDLRDTLPVAGSERSDIIPAGSWTAGSESLTGMKAILIPQELTPETYVEIRLGNRRFTYRPSSVHLNPGCSRTFTITVNNTGLDITTTINPWDNCPPVNGDANEEFGLELIAEMTLGKSNPIFTIRNNGDVVIDWGDECIDTNIFKHTYTDGSAIHNVKFYGTPETLIVFWCINNQVKTLDVSKNIALEQLWCHNNQLTSLDVNKNLALTHLYCQNNQLSVLNLNNNTALKHLFCYDNQLTNLDLSKNTELVRLDCFRNQLAILDVSNSIVLEQLFCYDNKITEISLNKLVALKYLYCYNNQLTTLDISNNEGLQQLFCYDNKLTALDVSKNSILTRLVCNNNPLITDQVALIVLANSLMNRTGMNSASLEISDSTSAAWIQSICDAKNWTIK